MIKAWFWHLGVGLLINVVISVVAALIYLLLVALLGSFMGFIVPLVFVHILIIVAALMMSFGLNEGLKVKNYVASEKSIYSNIWKKRIKKEKRTRSFFLQLLLLLFLGMASILMFSAIGQYEKAVLLPSYSISDEGLFDWELSLLLSGSAITWFIYWFCLFVHYIKARCKCRLVMSYVEKETIDCHTSVTYQEKTRNTYGTIGSVYADGKKIGDIKGDTGSYSLEREVQTTYWTKKCVCQFCGREKVFKESSSRFGNWTTSKS